MSAGLPQQLDAKRFAESNRHLEGEISLADCPRLEKAVRKGEGPVTVALIFALQPGGRLVVRGNIHARVSMECWRCLEHVVIELDCEVAVGIVADESEAKSLPTDLDPLIADGELNLFELIEDELILALPITPVHDRCEPPVTILLDGEHGLRSLECESPFAALASLKKE